MKRTNKTKENRKKRYYVYRRLGYDSRTAKALSYRSLDVSSLEISKRTGKLKQNRTTKEFINVKMDEYKRAKAIDNNRRKVSKIENDTNYTLHGLLTQDKRYKGETGRAITIIKNENRLSRNQAFYFYYYMIRYNLSYAETKKQLLSNREFEEYDRNKKG